MPCPLIRVVIFLLPLHLLVSRINETKITFHNFWGIRAVPLGGGRSGGRLAPPESVDDFYSSGLSRLPGAALLRGHSRKQRLFVCTPLGLGSLTQSRNDNDSNSAPLGNLQSVFAATI